MPTSSGRPATASRSVSRSRAMKRRSTRGLSSSTASPLKAETTSMAAQAHAKRRFAWACAAMLVVSAFNGLAVLLLKPLVDRLFIARDLDTLRLAVAGLPLLVGMKAAASYVQNYLMSWVGQ